MSLVLAALVGFALGSIPFGLLLTRAAGLGDLRRLGSGNIGATNVLRTGRRDLAAATLLLDAGKGAAAVLIADWGGAPSAAAVAAVAAVAGHVFSPWLGFAGGKGVATGLGALAAAAWPVGLTAAAVWLAVAGIARISSLAALAAFAAAPVAALAWADRAGVAAAATIAVLVWLRHAGNIRRLIAGTEPRIGRR